jgi:hypothetical protein
MAMFILIMCNAEIAAKINKEIFDFMRASIISIANSTGILVICNTKFRNTNFLCSVPFSFPVLRVTEWYV